MRMPIPVHLVRNSGATGKDCKRNASGRDYFIIVFLTSKKEVLESNDLRNGFEMIDRSGF